MMAKVLVSIDDRLLKRVDAAARKAGLDRSAYLGRLAAQSLDAAPAALRASRAAAFKEMRALGKRYGTPGDATEFIRRSRDERGEHLGRADRAD